MNHAKILIADPEAGAPSPLVKALLASGYRVSLATNGAEICAAVIKFQPDLCLVDHQLEGVGEFLGGQVKLGPEDPLVVVSCGSLDDERALLQMMEKFGAAAYIKKPYRVEETLRTIDSLLQVNLHRSPPPSPASQGPALRVAGSNTPPAGSSPGPVPSKPPPGRTTPIAQVRLGSAPASQPKARAHPVSTMRISPEHLKQEMEKIRLEIADKQTPLAMSAMPGQTNEIGPSEGPTLTSHDIFGALIKDIESGRVNEGYSLGGASNPPPMTAKSELAKPASIDDTHPGLEPELPGTAGVAPIQPISAAGSNGNVPSADIGKIETSQSLVQEGFAGGNEYQLLNKIATGGMAEVWKAKLIGEKGFEKIVAIKKILPHLSDNQDFISMFIDEAKVAANLTHPNIAQIYELGKMGDSFFIAMEYVSGHNLRVVLNQCNSLGIKMPAEIVVFIGMKLCNALHYAHNKKGYDDNHLSIVHRDVSPQNILISNEGEIKLVDFGIAKASIKATQTVAGSLKGKLLYMSPEQAEGKALDCRSDIFSLASVLHEALTGRKLFAGDSELSILKNVRNASFTPMRALNPDISEALETLLLKALAKYPKNRYDSAKALEQDLKEFMRQEKIHINEGDVAEYLKLAFEENIEKLRTFGTTRAEALLDLDEPTPAAPSMATATTPAPAPQKPRFLAKLWITVFAAIALLALLVWILLPTKGRISKPSAAANPNLELGTPPPVVAEPVVADTVPPIHTQAAEAGSQDLPLMVEKDPALELLREINELGETILAKQNLLNPMVDPLSAEAVALAAEIADLEAKRDEKQQGLDQLIKGALPDGSKEIEAMQEQLRLKQEELDRLRKSKQ